MYFTDRGIEELESRRGEETVSVAWLAARLQDEGAASFVKSWNDLMERIDSKRVEIRKAS